MTGLKSSLTRFKNIPPVIRYFYSIVWQCHKPYIFTVIANMLVTGLAPFINIYVPKLIIDELLGSRQVPRLASLVALLVLLNLAVSAANQIIKYLSGKYQFRLEQKWDALLAEKCMTMDFKYTEDPKALQQRTKALQGIGFYSGGIEGFSSALIAFVSGLITFAGTLYVIAQLSPLILLVLVAVTVANMLIVAKTTKDGTDHAKGLADMNRRGWYYGRELGNFKYGKDIRLYSAASLIETRIRKYLKEEWDPEFLFTRKQNRFVALSSVLTGLQLAMVYGYIGVRVVLRLITIGEFQMLVTAALSFAGSLRSVVDTLINIANFADYMNDYRTFILLPDTTRAGEKIADNSKEHIFEFRNVSFKYPNAEDYALRNVSVTLTPGKKLSVVGQNGAGKTTFIKLLCRLYDPTEGEILMDGVDIREYELDSYRELISVVFQDYKLFSFALRENIAAGAHAEDDRVLDAIDKAGFEERYHKLEKGLDTAVYKDFDRNGIEFSGGESQKIAIARAVYKNAPITILDEPTAALDPIAECDIYSRFNSLIGYKSAIYISHRLSSCRFCDSIAVFKDGSIVQYGSHDELLRDEGSEYAALWSAQAKYYE
jgi:ATP-binding cassette, subfamily B, bacterial